LGDSADQLDNGCWFLIPKWCGYEFQPQAPDGLVLVDEPDDMIELNADPHIPQWELTITRTSEKADLLGEPNVTVGDNQQFAPTIYKLDIKEKVIRVIAIISGYDIEYITPEKKLKKDLGMSGYHRKALAPAFIRIAKSYNPDAKITRSQCERLKTVKDAVDLVTKAASIKDRDEVKK
jgi:acyl carrier protein